MKKASPVSTIFKQLIDMGWLLSSSRRMGWCRGRSSTVHSPHPSPPGLVPPRVPAMPPNPPVTSRQQSSILVVQSLPPSAAVPGSEPPAHKHQQQHQEFHSISNNWQVPRTPMHHYPPDMQQRMRSRWERADSAAPVQPPPLEATAPAEQLLAVLNWEAATGYNNGTGSTGERFAAWAAGRLLQLAGRTQPAASPRAELESVAQAQVQAPPAAGTDPAAGLAATCASLADELVRYDSLDAAGRALLTQRARLAAEELMHATLVQYKQQSRVGRYGGSTAPSQPGGPPRVSTGATAPRQQQGMNQPPTAPPQRASPARAQQQYPSAAPAADAAGRLQVAPPATLLGEGLALAVDPDAAAALAHEEETAIGGGPLEQPLREVQHDREAPSAAPVGEAAGSEGEGEGDKAGGRRRKRVVAPATLGFRQSFAEAAAAFTEASDGPRVASLVGGEQRTAEWHRLRDRRLTASAFSKALGFFSGDREALWEEKVGLRPGFAGNEATAWGTRSEAVALEDYQVNTGQAIEGCMFQVKHDDMVHGWLGASPDGLIGGLQIAPEAGRAGPCGMRGAGLLAGQGPGILEVKCPYNKGRPEAAVPPDRAIWYYMPQVQGLMDIFDRDWCNLYIWTPMGGSGLYHIPRDRRYWGECFGVLSDFWWSHVVPARQARERQGQQAQQGQYSPSWEAYRPPAVIPATTRLKMLSKEMAAAAPATFFPSKRAKGG